jgi:hypothetical protein
MQCPVASIESSTRAAGHRASRAVRAFHEVCDLKAMTFIFNDARLRAAPRRVAAWDTALTTG